MSARTRGLVGELLAEQVSTHSSKMWHRLRTRAIARRESDAPLSELHADR